MVINLNITKVQRKFNVNYLLGLIGYSLPFISNCIVIVLVVSLNLWKD